jgi:hypothetical protein
MLEYRNVGLFGMLYHIGHDLVHELILPGKSTGSFMNFLEFHDGTACGRWSAGLFPAVGQL